MPAFVPMAVTLSPGCSRVLPLGMNMCSPRRTMTRTTPSGRLTSFRVPLREQGPLFDRVAKEMHPAADEHPDVERTRNRHDLEDLLGELSPRAPRPGRSPGSRRVRRGPPWAPGSPASVQEADRLLRAEVPRAHAGHEVVLVVRRGGDEQVRLLDASHTERDVDVIAPYTTSRPGGPDASCAPTRGTREPPHDRP